MKRPTTVSAYIPEAKLRYSVEMTRDGLIVQGSQGHRGAFRHALPTKVDLESWMETRNLPEYARQQLRAAFGDDLP